MTVKKLMVPFLCLLLLCASASAELLSDDLLLEEDEVISYDNVTWSFPVALEDLDPDFVRLANKHMFLPKNYSAQPIVAVKTRKVYDDGTTNGGVRKASGGEMKLQATCYAALSAMFEAAERDGIRLYLKSAWRSWSTQNTMYYNRLKKYGYDDGYVIKPGASDHQTGLGCDIVSYAWRDRGMNGKFGNTDEAKWMAAHCAEYGFILRYPKDKEAITEIVYEPWHLRYVGVAAAQYIMGNGLCLEEFHDQLSAAIDDFIAAGGPRSQVEALIQVDQSSTY